MKCNKKTGKGLVRIKSNLGSLPCRPMKKIVIFLMLFGCWGSSRADESSASPHPVTLQEQDYLLEQLQSLEENIHSSRSRLFLQACKDLEPLLKDRKQLLAFYLDQVKKTEFDARGKTSFEFRDWRDKNEGLAGDEHLDALGLQLEYLLLTLQHQEARNDADRDRVVLKLMQYFDRLVAQRAKLGRYSRLLNGDVRKSIFAEALGLGTHIRAAGTWQARPDDVSRSYEEFILPYVNAKGDAARIRKTWDTRIAQQALHVTGLPLARVDRAGRFCRLVLPDLHWGKASDLYHAGSEREALQEMLRLIREHPDHPAASSWISEMRKHIMGMKAAAAEPVPLEEAPAFPEGLGESPGPQP